MYALYMYMYAVIETEALLSPHLFLFQKCSCCTYGKLELYSLLTCCFCFNTYRDSRARVRC